MPGPEIQNHLEGRLGLAPERAQCKAGSDRDAVSEVMELPYLLPPSAQSNWEEAVEAVGITPAEVRQQAPQSNQ